MRERTRCLKEFFVAVRCFFKEIWGIARCIFWSRDIHGVEYVIEEVVEKSDAVVGWNPHCIIDAIQTLVNGEEEWIKPCDIEEEA